MQGAQKLLPITGTVYATGTTTVITDAFVEIRDTLKRQVFGNKTNSGGTFETKASSGTVFELVVRKPGYQPSRILTGTVSGAGVSVGTVYLAPITSSINATGTASAAGTDLSGRKAFVSVAGINANGTENAKWFGKEILIQTGGTFELSGIPTAF
jgi:hypothetical protein